MNTIRLQYFFTSWLALVSIILLGGCPASGPTLQNQQSNWKPGPCRPVSERTSDMGCWIVASQQLGQLSRAPVYWHLYTYSARSAAEAAKRPNDTLVESLGKVWLLSISEAGSHPPGGMQVAEIGPLPVNADAGYTAEYLEAIFPSGFDTTVHRHPASAEVKMFRFAK